ncbi:hypothetical protein F0L74_12805 [Chitinophaga agrisoli]|uniref:Copper-binding protein MbnP-like domain-containing protein n=1 Tax=Chitinophaga agrisoli TaxID=2607653 RepID=A0A5B2VW70_9BACT|nr:MbnP family protein [Chitinophaga agrisoli]KAA2243375.1 hypothetical protein F0L74_12805 [Chitinophaga agrisoli]
MKKSIFLSAIVCLLAGAITAFNTIKADSGELSLNFKHVVNGVPLKLNDNSAHYANANNDEYTVSTFKYYISNITLTTTKGKDVVIPNICFLINAADPASLKQSITGVPAGKYKGISFTIGVDSARNFAGAQTGCLDPANGMFWTWNSGYIFLKLEGYSPQSTAKLHKLTFHVGGIKRQNTLRTFSHSFNKPLQIHGNEPAAISITTDAAALFKGQNLVDFAKLNSTMGGPNAVLIADNYKNGLFSITNVQQGRYEN